MLAEGILAIVIETTLLTLLLIALYWNKLNKFFHESYTFFNVAFVSFYFLEQATFITTSYMYPNKINLLVGFFALVVLSTVALQGVMMESKSRKSYEKLGEYNKSSMQKVGKVRKTYEDQINNLREYIEYLEIENNKLKGKNKRL